MRKFKGIICAAAIAAFGMVGAGCDDDPVASEFDAIDTNANGLVSAAEWHAAFSVWDVNHDGSIAQSEYLLHSGFTDLDVDANGLISEAEWDAAITRWDLNGDGNLTANELFF